MQANYCFASLLVAQMFFWVWHNFSTFHRTVVSGTSELVVAGLVEVVVKPVEVVGLVEVGEFVEVVDPDDKVVDGIFISVVMFVEVVVCVFEAVFSLCVFVVTVFTLSNNTTSSIRSVLGNKSTATLFTA